MPLVNQFLILAEKRNMVRLAHTLVTASLEPESRPDLVVGEADGVGEVLLVDFVADGGEELLVKVGGFLDVGDGDVDVLEGTGGDWRRGGGLFGRHGDGGLECWNED